MSGHSRTPCTAPALGFVQARKSILSLEWELAAALSGTKKGLQNLVSWDPAKKPGTLSGSKKTTSPGDSTAAAQDQR